MHATRTLWTLVITLASLAVPAAQADTVYDDMAEAANALGTPCDFDGSIRIECTPSAVDSPCGVLVGVNSVVDCVYHELKPAIDAGLAAGTATQDAAVATFAAAREAAGF